VGGLAVCEEIAELALVVRAHRLVQRYRSRRGGERLLDVLQRQPSRLGKLLLRRLATELDLEPARRARQLLLALDDVHGDADSARVIRDGALHRLPDPPSRVGRELVPAAPVELLDGAIQTERPLLDQIEERHAEAAVAFGDRHDEPQVRLDHAPLGAPVATLDRLREHDFLVRGQELVLADVGEEELQAVARAGRSVGLVDHRFGLRLRVLLLDDGLAHLEPDTLELADHVLDLGVTEVVLDRERLELGRLDPAALLARLDQRAGALGLKQFVQLALGQVVFDVLSFLRPALETCPRPEYRPRLRARTHAHGGPFRCGLLIMDAFRSEMLSNVFRPGYEVRYERFRVVRFFTGPRSRRAWSSSAARSGVTDSIESPARRLAFVSPSVTYGPNRPSLRTIGLPLAGSAPSSLSGGAAARPPRRRGSASLARASSSVIVKSCSSVSSERDSFPLRT